MGQWEPLAERIPVDMRRLATQLRRMKDRSAMTVPALAARTAHPVEGWERAFAGRQLPPLDAVEVLAQASGADYDRIGELWRLAEKAAVGSGDRGRWRDVPYPDPLDPLGPEEGLPRHRRRALLVATLSLLAVASLVALLFTAGASTGRAPGGRADGTAGGPAVPKGAPAAGGPRASGRSGAAGGQGGPGGPAAGAATRGASGAAAGGGSGDPGDDPSAAMGSLTPSGVPRGASAGAGPSSAGSPPAGGAAGGAAAGGTGSGGGGTGGTAGAGGPGTPSAPATTPPTASSGPSPSPSQGRGRLCLGLIVLGVCIG